MTSFINDEGNEIVTNEDVTFTRQVASFRNFKIKGDVSVIFTVPNNSASRKALNYYGISQLDTPVFSTNYFNLVKNGNNLMRGNIVIESDNGREISLFFISGNANWFKSLDFSCKDIRNKRLRVMWTYSWIENQKTATEGIIFPHIDWMFKREKFDNYQFASRIIDESRGFRDFYPYANIFPCLYIHTLVNECAKVAGIKIDGTLIEDHFYKSLIITPEGPELYNYWGKVVSYSVGYDPGIGSGWTSFDPDDDVTPGPNAIIDINDIAPNMKALDIIKYLCFNFGCIPVFDEYTQTLTLNIIDRIDKNASYDWSDYVQGYNIKYDQKQNNYLRVATAPELEIEEYNIANPNNLYSELNIETGKLDGSSVDLYKNPFAPVYDDMGTTPLKWATPFIEFYSLEDTDEIEFTSVTDNSGKARFNLQFNFDTSELYQDACLVIRIKDDGDVYSGYHLINNATSTYIDSGADYISDVTGYAYIQKISENKAGPRVLVCIPNLAVNKFTSADSVNIYRYGDVSTVAYAYFHKPTYSLYPDLNGYRPGLSYRQFTEDEITETTAPPDPPVLDVYTITLAVAAETLVGDSVNFYYKIDSGAWTYLTSNNDLGYLNTVYPTYQFFTLNPILVTEGSTLQIGCKDNALNNINFGLGDSPAAVYNTYCGQDPTTQFTPSADITKYLQLDTTVGPPDTYTVC